MKKLKKDILDMTKTGVVMGVGGTAISAAGGNPAAIGTMSNYMPVMGNTMGAGGVFRTMNSLRKQTKRKKK